jgi:hypothetical protein
MTIRIATDDGQDKLHLQAMVRRVQPVLTRQKAPREAGLLHVSFRGHQASMLIREPCPGGSGGGGAGAVVLESSCALASGAWVWTGGGGADGGGGNGGGLVVTVEMLIGTILFWILPFLDLATGLCAEAENES